MMMRDNFMWVLEMALEFCVHDDLFSYRAINIGFSVCYLSLYIDPTSFISALIS